MYVYVHCNLHTKLKQALFNLLINNKRKDGPCLDGGHLMHIGSYWVEGGRVGIRWTTTCSRLDGKGACWNLMEGVISVRWNMLEWLLV